MSGWKDKLKGVSLRSISNQIQNAKDWFIARIRKAIRGEPDDEIDTGRGIGAYGSMKSDIQDPFGRLSFFIYKAKYGETLPYWDADPLTLLYNEDAEHLYGINLHYVPPRIRAKILESLMSYLKSARTPKAYFDVSYSLLKGLSTASMIKPCVKTYLKSNLKTVPRVIKPESWHKAILLPTANWQKATSSRVWKDSGF